MNGMTQPSRFRSGGEAHQTCGWPARDRGPAGSRAAKGMAGYSFSISESTVGMPVQSRWLRALRRGKDPESVTRSAYFAPLLCRGEAAAVELSRQPMVQALLLTLPASAWAAVGVDHPLGADYKGFPDLDPAVLEADNLAHHGRVVTPELLRSLIPCGRAEDVLGYLQPLIDEGLNHVIIYSAAAALKPRLAASHLYEQRRLIRMLKNSTPGRFNP